MSRFTDLDGATLVNNFTLHHKDKLSDGRPFMSTCVPQGIWVELKDVEILHAVDWQHGGFDNPAEGTPVYKIASRLLARGTFKDSITVFRMPGGEVASFSGVHVQIMPIEKGAVGGAKNASTLDGVGYSGMSSSNVPEEGLMAGEPGSVMYIDPRKDSWPSDHEKPYLQLEGYIDEAEFSGLVQRMSLMSSPIRAASLRMVAELFQHEVEASLSEPYHSHSYGMLLRGDDSTYGITRARAESIQVAYKPAVIAPEPDHLDSLVEENKKAEAISIDNLPPDLIAKISKDVLVKNEKRIGLLTGIVGLAAAFVIGKIVLG